jgi:hypothetical protein
MHLQDHPIQKEHKLKDNKYYNFIISLKQVIDFWVLIIKELNFYVLDFYYINIFELIHNRCKDQEIMDE